MKKSVLSAFALAASMASVANAALADGATKFVGNITTMGSVRNDFGTYWNQITAENECKWASIEGTRGQYNFSGCKAAYNWAKNNGGHFKFHALIWGSQYPNWLNGMSVADTRTAITQWFDKVKENFPELEMIDVVNEAIRTGNNSYHSCYTTNSGDCQANNIMAALGGDNNGDYAFVTKAFQMARERWPKAILIYNDYNTIQYHVDQGINLINTIKKNGAPVDAYGLQAHDMMTQGGGANGTGGGGNCMNLSTLKSTIDKIWNQTHMPMFISEYDINTSDDNTQKRCYEEQISYFMENEHIAGITIWGYINGATWLSNSGIMQPESKPSYQNPNVKATDRPAMTWLKEYLSTHKGNNSTKLATGVAVDPVPQKPFNATNTPWAVPGKIEAEDFDITGAGINDDGTSNISYSDKDSKNQGNSSYRPDATDADIYVKPFGTVIGYNETGEWFEYTIDVKEAGDYTLFAAVASANNTNGFQFSLDGKDLTNELKAPKATTPDSYEEFDKISVNVNIAKAGKHVLRLTVTGDWFDIDYFNFVKGKNATDDAPLSSSAATNNSSSSAAISSSTSSASNGNSSASVNSGSSTSVINGSSASIANGSSASVENGSSASVINGSSASITDNPYSSDDTAPGFISTNPAISGTQENPGEAPEAIFGSLHLGKASASTYEVFDLKGQHIARFTANNMAEATQMWKNGLVKNGSNTKGIVLIHNRHSGETVQVKTIR